MIDGPASVVWDQAENRMRRHAGAAVCGWSGRSRQREAVQDPAPAPGHPDPRAGRGRRARPSWSSCSAEGGVEATQATVSRDLEELGAVKVRAAGGESRLRRARAARTSGSLPRSTCGGCSATGWSRSRQLGQPGGGAHAARLGPRGRLGPRPGRPAGDRRARWRATTPSSWWRPSGSAGPTGPAAGPGRPGRACDWLALTTVGQSDSRRRREES